VFVCTEGTLNGTLFLFLYLVKLFTLIVSNNDRTNVLRVQSLLTT